MSAEDGAAQLPEPQPERPAQPCIPPEHLLFKNRLQEYTQRSALPLPMYQTVNEGSPHLPKFRSTVLVDGVYYTSINTFLHRKAAEQDVAKVALDGITQKIKDEGCPLILQDIIFCKSILNEYAVKVNLEKPTYTTTQSQGLIPIFVSSLLFNGVTYTGEFARNKKEAEQLAARAVILSILGNTDSGTVITEIIKSKLRLYDALHNVKDSHNAPVAVNPETSLGFPLSKRKEVEITGCAYNMPSIEIPKPLSGQVNNIPTVSTNNMPNIAIPVTLPCQIENIPAMQQPFHEFKKPKLEPLTEVVTPPIAFVPPVLVQPLDVGSSSAKKRRRRNKKDKKKDQVNANLSLAMVPFSQVPPCSVAQ